MTSERKGNYMRTFTGGRFYHLDPRPEDIRIEDIAHGLSQECRFGGQTSTFYSVAQHSVLVARLCPPEHQLYGLLHDGSEAYYKDLPRPLKLMMPEYKKAEKRAMQVIKRIFSLPDKEPEAVKLYDCVLCCTEARDLMNAPDWALHGPLPLLPDRIKPWAPAKAKREFLAAFEMYCPVKAVRESYINPVFI